MLKCSNKKLAIGIPLSFPMVPASFFDSFTVMEKPNYQFLRSNNGPIDEMRNEIVEKALRSDCTHLIVMDTDMVYHPETITKLMTYDYDVVGALCYRRYPPFDPIMMKGRINHYQTIEDWTDGDLVEVDATGTGCLMFKIDVFRKVPKPWFRFRPNPNKKLGGTIGEDIGFCSKLKKLGFNIYVDTSIPCDHLTTLAVNKNTWKLYKAMKEIENKKLGGK